MCSLVVLVLGSTDAIGAVSSTSMVPFSFGCFYNEVLGPTSLVWCCIHGPLGIAMGFGTSLSKEGKRMGSQRKVVNGDVEKRGS